MGTVVIGRVARNHISSRKARNFIATHQIMYHSSHLVYPRVPLPHQLLLNLHRRKLSQTPKFQQQVEVKRRARTHQHEETRGMNQQKSKIPQKKGDEELQSGELQGVPDWLQEFKHGLLYESAPEHRDASSSSHELPLEPREKVVQRKHSIFIHFPKDQSRDICLRTKTTRASCRRRAEQASPEDSEWFDENKQSSNDCKKAMRDLDGASDQDIMFGHARDVTVAYSLSNSTGKDLTDRHKNSDVRRLQPEGKTRSTIT